MIHRLKRGCIKCGNQGLKIKDKNDTVMLRVAANVEYIKEEDKLLRTCRRCGYQWLEDCID